MRRWLRNRYDWEAIRHNLHGKGIKLNASLVRHQEGWKTIAQMGFGVVALVGISMYSVPIALIIAGVAGIVAMERQ